MSPLLALVLSFCGWQTQDTPSIERRVPPVGIELPSETQSQLEKRLTSLESAVDTITESPRRADIEILSKAVRYALQHREFYRIEDVQKAQDLLELGESLVEATRNGERRDRSQRGLIVRGYRSSIDGSVQPYGLEIPDAIDLSKPVPLYVWLHGRGDRTTDLHFIHERLRRRGTVHPPNAIVLHPFGRQCIGFKSAGEIDVLEAISDVAADFPIDSRRIVLMGFSMGGAGAWHLAAHYPDRWVAASPGAGFAETAEYNRLQPADYPPSYTQTLWQVYDVPNYTLNLLNFPVVAYSGENDKQIQAAQVMERAFDRESRTLQHIVGPGMGHEYHPDSLRELLSMMNQSAEVGKPTTPRTFQLQTPTLRYSVGPGVQLLRLQRHWSDSRLIGEWSDDHTLNVSTKNIRAFRLSAPVTTEDVRVNIDGQILQAQSLDPADDVAFVQQQGVWTIAPWNEDADLRQKSPGLQGPIDDAFLDPFLVVLPSGEGFHDTTQAWTTAESEYFRKRWRYLFRGDVRVKLDREVTGQDHENFNLILWGDPQSNRCIQAALPHLPLSWDRSRITIGESHFASETHVPLLIYPNPSAPHHYIVLNSGPTFRDGHDRTNSLQNPQLPDWAALDIREPRTDLTAGKVVEAGFFDEFWQIPQDDQ